MRNIFCENRLIYKTGKSNSSLRKDLVVPIKEKTRGVSTSDSEKLKKQRDFAKKRLLVKSKEKRMKFREYMKEFNSEQIYKMLDVSANMSILDLRRGGSLRLLYEKESDFRKKVKLKKNLHENQGYAQMTAQFAKEKTTKGGKTYLEVDLKGIDRYEQQLGAGHICPPTWIKVSIEDTNGNSKTGYRKVPEVDNGIYGTKIGYYTDEGEYLPVYSGYKIYPLEIKYDSKQVQKEAEFYKKEKKHESQRKNSSVESLTSSRESYEQAKVKFSGLKKSELAEKGITPFIVKLGYQMSSEEKAIYTRERKEAGRLSRMSMQDRMKIMQERYRLKDALDLAFRALRINERYRKHFYAYNDAIMHIESSYNPIAVNRRHGKIARSTASGAYQILNPTWKGDTQQWLRNTRKSQRYRRYYNKKVQAKYRINFNLLNSVDFSQPLPGLATPYQHAIFHNISAFRGSRMYKWVMPFDEVFDKLESRALSSRMKYSYQAYLYANWRNGHGGAKILLKMIQKGIPFPRNKTEAREYFDQMPNCWQKKRGFNDFAMLVRACRSFIGRFNKNLREQGAE